MDNVFILNGALGPNRCVVNHYVTNMRIEVDSEKEILWQDMAAIEEYLGLNTKLGWRGDVQQIRMNYTDHYLTIWRYLEASDRNWSR